MDEWEANAAQVNFEKDVWLFFYSIYIILQPSVLQNLLVGIIFPLLMEGQLLS